MLLSGHRQEGKSGQRAIPALLLSWIHATHVLLLTTLRGAKQRLAIAADGGGRKRIR